MRFQSITCRHLVILSQHGYSVYILEPCYSQYIPCSIVHFYFLIFVIVAGVGTQEDIISQQGVLDVVELL